MRALAAQGTDLGAADWHSSPRQKTAAMVAAEGGQIEVIRALADLGVDVEADFLGRTPVMYAASAGRLAAVRALVALGADTRVTAYNGRTAAAMATASNNSHIAAWLKRCAGWGDIHRACDNRRGRGRLVTLLRAGAGPSLRSPAGHTPLQICRLEDPKAGALPADAATTATVEAALLAWHPERHGLWPDTFRAAVTTLMLLQQRLKRRAEQMEEEEQAARAAGEQDGGAQQRARRAGRLAVFLPHELWVLWVVPGLARAAWSLSRRELVAAASGGKLRAWGVSGNSKSDAIRVALAEARAEAKAKATAKAATAQ